MTRQALPKSTPVKRRQPLLSVDEAKKTGNTKEVRGKKFGEVVGGTTAECTAICCCCPCTVMEFLVLGLYRVPTGLCRKAWRKRKRQRMMKKNPGLLRPPKGPSRADVEAELEQVAEKGQGGDDAKETENLEKEMWDAFYGAGFWRSPSQRGT